MILLYLCTKSSTYFARAQGDVVVATYDGLFVVKLLDLQKRQLVSANDAYAPVSLMGKWTISDAQAEILSILL
ncbi:hypothetical protein ST37_10120 [Vibrio sp. qd031]|uniref:hypothetical protein n=1 Tax=Vibrio sp. qd031 TaxID=1603038 RepID=UPI000A10096B|nr:hypothetical protein [Vibrio sp. qd031]ORT50242.1 hypothetical protein ST37_10120 [Vibrio sp. qd031]